MALAVLLTATFAVGAGVWLGVVRVWGDTSQAVGVDTIVAAVGDMACAPDAPAMTASTAPAKTVSVPTEDGSATCRQMAVSDAVLAARPSLLLALGDTQYEKGAPQGWGPYDRSYGRLRDITHPVVGNHEYLTPGARGYYDYFGDRAGERGSGYYSFDAGGWHFIALNSQCQEAGGCGPSSPQVAWLRADLDRHRSACTLAYWHIPRFSSGQHGDHAAYRTIWQELVNHGGDLVLVGHDHHYERLAPMSADGRREKRAGIRSFIVGTGGRNLRKVNGQHVNSERIIDDSFGFLQLRLRDGYTWQFKNERGRVLDEGEGKCH